MNLFESDLTLFHACGYILLSILIGRLKKYTIAVLFVALSLIFLHGLGLLLPWFALKGFEFGLLKAVVWTMWLASILVCIEAFFRNIFPRITVPIFFLTGVFTLLDGILPSPTLSSDLGIVFQSHILIAMLSYACLVFTSARAATIHLQENSLREPSIKQPDHSLPSLVELDASLQRLLLITFVLLSGTLLTGILVNISSGNAFLIFDHKTFFSLLAWILIGMIIGGKQFFGWRGRMVAKMTMIGCFLVILSYIGTQFVIEIILEI